MCFNIRLNLAEEWLGELTGQKKIARMNYEQKVKINENGTIENAQRKSNIYDTAISEWEREWDRGNICRDKGSFISINSSGIIR